MMQDVVKIGPQVDIDHPRLAPAEFMGNLSKGLMGGLLGTIPIRPGLEIGFKDRFQNELKRSRMLGILRTRTLPLSLGISCFRVRIGR
jgi:hypothetical protein